MRPELLHVVTAITNPERFRSRVALFHAFAKRVRDAGAQLHVAEAAFGARPFEVTGPGDLQLRTSHELWHKENLLNLLINRLPADAEYVAWVDADLTFARPDWAAETVHQLQHFPIVQMWSHCQDLSSRHAVVQDENGSEHLPSMAYQHVHGGSPAWSRIAYGRHPGHCGYAWAARRKTLDALGGLIDFSICGANDHHMARAFLGEVGSSIHGASSPGLKRALQVWGDRADRVIRRDLGYVDGLVLHHWHGPKSGRGYRSRWRILTDSQFDPAADICRDAQGVYQLVDDGTPRMAKLRDDLRLYFRQRREDQLSDD
jgi:hypothetical protein